MKILLIGRGTIASIYGWVFSQAGHDVTHLVRPGRAELSGRKIMVDIIDQRKKRGANPGNSYSAKCTEDWNVAGSNDLIVVPVRFNQFNEVIDKLSKVSKPRLGVLFFNNCWDDPQALRARLPYNNTIWGFPLAGGEFKADGTLLASLMTQVHLEQADSGNALLSKEIITLFKSLELNVVIHKDMKAWLWRHFAINAGLIAYAMGAGISSAQLVSSPKYVTEGLKLSREATKVVLARGIAANSEANESSLVNLPLWISSRILCQVARSNQAAWRIMTSHFEAAELALLPKAVVMESERLGKTCPGITDALAQVHTETLTQ